MVVRRLVERCLFNSVTGFCQQSCQLLHRFVDFDKKSGAERLKSLFGSSQSLDFRTFNVHLNPIYTLEV